MLMHEMPKKSLRVLFTNENQIEAKSVKHTE